EPLDKAVRANGRSLTAPRDLRKGDTLALGEAQVVVTDASRTLLRLEIHHLVGNATVAPAATLATLLVGGDGDEDVEIHPLTTLRITPLVTAARPSAPAGRVNPRRWVFAGLAVAVLAVVSIVTT